MLALASLVLAGLLMPVTAAWAQTDPAAPPDTPALVLAADNPSVKLEPRLEFLLDGSGQLSADQVEQLPAGSFAPTGQNPSWVLGQGALWMRFEAVTQDTATHWRLTLPKPTLDEAFLYYRDSAGQWVQQQAGDSLPLASWTQHGRYPAFDLSPDTGRTVRYFLQVKQARSPYSTLPELATGAQFAEARQNEHMLLGIYFGLTVLVILLSLTNAVAYRDAAFGIYALHVCIFALAQASYTGLAALYLWPPSLALNNAVILILLPAAFASAMWFVRTVAAPRRYSHLLDDLMLALMGLLPLAGVLDAVFATPLSFFLLNAVAGVSVLVLLVGVAIGLVAYDRDARWVALGFSPVLVLSLFPVVRNLDMISTGFMTEYGRMIGSAIEMPILFYGLYRRVSQKRNLQARATAMGNTDPLTGLHSRPVLLDKLRLSLTMVERYQLPFALLLVNLANLARLQKQHGSQAAEHAMVIAAERIRSIAGPGDTVARVGDSQFAVLVEGPIKGESANDVATRILASGLRPSSQFPEAETLMFHIAVAHVGEGAGLTAAKAEAGLARMLQVLREMNDGSRKAIRTVKL